MNILYYTLLGFLIMMIGAIIGLIPIILFGTGMLASVPYIGLYLDYRHEKEKK